MRWTAIKLRDLAHADHLGRPCAAARAHADLTITGDAAVYRSFGQVRSAEALMRYALAVDLVHLRRAAPHRDQGARSHVER